jgi:hypothetical protein
MAAFGAFGAIKAENDPSRDRQYFFHLSAAFSQNGTSARVSLLT